jgi:putative membrane protein
MCHDEISNARFKIMERKLYFGIATPGALITTILGVWLLSLNFTYYLHANWMLAKLVLVIFLWLYHLYLGKLYFGFKDDRNKHGHVFYRWLNEVPVVFLVGIVILVIIKPAMVF